MVLGVMADPSSVKSFPGGARSWGEPGAVSGAKLEKVLFELNSMSRADKTGAPIDLFLGRSVNSLLPNAGNKVISMKKEVERRRCQQEKWMKNSVGFHQQNSRPGT